MPAEKPHWPPAQKLNETPGSANNCQNKRYLLTSFTCPYCWLKYRAHWGHNFFDIDCCQGTVFDWIAGSNQLTYNYCHQERCFLAWLNLYLCYTYSCNCRCFFIMFNPSWFCSVVINTSYRWVMFTIVVRDMQLPSLSIFAVISTVNNPARFIELMDDNIDSMVTCKSHNAIISTISTKFG